MLADGSIKPSSPPLPGFNQSAASAVSVPNDVVSNASGLQLSSWRELNFRVIVWQGLQFMLN